MPQPDLPTHLAADVVVIGSGSAALAAALTAAVGGAEVIVLEKAEVIGGTSAMSGAGVWIPANHHMLEAGMADSAEDALAYIRAAAPPGWQASEDALWQAFVGHAPAALKFLETHTPLRFELVHHPDLYSELPGGRFTGRMVSPQIISRNILGRWRNRVRRTTLTRSFTYRELIVGTVLSAPVTTLLRMAPRLIWRWLTRSVGMGNALMTGLLKGCLDRGCTIMTGSRARRLIEETPGGRVIGVEVETAGGLKRIAARRGVVLATGGFEWNAEMRAHHFPGEVGLIGSPATNTGDGHAMAAALGAAMDHMDQANIYPSTVTTYEGRRQALPLNELQQPHCILVNRLGQRFVSEGDPNIGVALDARDPATGEPIHVPAWRIFDARAARASRVQMWLARREPGWLRRADSLADLARQIGLDPAALAATVERFNGFARAGSDTDFRRGESAWERFYTGDPNDPAINGALGTIEAPPFWATPFHRAILVTKGGARTDERCQVLRPDGSRIAGLYCAGIAMANPIGSRAVGAGTTLGPCLAFGHIAGLNVLRENA